MDVHKKIRYFIAISIMFLLAMMLFSAYKKGDFFSDEKNQGKLFPKETKAKVQKRLDDLARQQIKIQTVGSDELKQIIRQTGGRLILVNFWATWCQPCHSEIPVVLQVKAKLRKQGLKVLLVSLDQPQQETKVIDFLEKKGAFFKSYMKDYSENRFVSSMFPQWKGGMPVSVIYNANGQVILGWQGAASFQFFRTQILKILKGAQQQRATR